MELSLEAVSDADIRISQVYMEMLVGLVDGSKVSYRITKVHDSIDIKDTWSSLLFIWSIPGIGLSKCIFYYMYVSLYSVIFNVFKIYIVLVHITRFPDCLAIFMNNKQKDYIWRCTLLININLDRHDFTTNGRGGCYVYYSSLLFIYGGI